MPQFQYLLSLSKFISLRVNISRLQLCIEFLKDFCELVNDGSQFCSDRIPGVCFVPETLLIFVNLLFGELFEDFELELWSKDLCLATDADLKDKPLQSKFHLTDYFAVDVVKMLKDWFVLLSVGYLCLVEIVHE